MMKFDFRSHCPKELFPFLMVLNNESENVFIVGGAVRDMLTWKKPYDWDVVTDTPMDRLIEVFEESGFRVTQNGVAHFVLNVYFSDFEVEVSNFRKDVVCNGRQAEVEIGTIEEDAARRDFTINALYINTLTNELIDPNGTGINDVKNGVLRFIGNPKDRIREDYLRATRFYRFISKGFIPEKKSLKAVREMWNEAYKNTTPERVRMEIEKMTKIRRVI